MSQWLMLAIIGRIGLPVPRIVSVALLRPVMVAFVVWYSGIRVDAVDGAKPYLSAE
jgi:hypothetical protein